MTRIPDKIRSIDGSKETLKLVVRITDLWFVGTPNKSEQAEMVFVDSEGDQIHAICKSDHLKSWKADLKENCTYAMHNFKVVKNDGQFRVCEHEYKLFFIGVTVVREADWHELPFKEFGFVEFANVVAGNFVSGLLDVVCVTVGTISKIVMDNHSWCYPACAQCHRKTDIQTGPFTCGCGKDNDHPVLRYRVEVMVTQNNESRKFLLWDRECVELIGETADDVNRVKIEDGDLYLNASPQALDKLLGHVLAFKVRIQSKFKNAVVRRYSKDLDLINVVLEMLPDSEACSKIDSSNVDCNDATQAERQSLSVIDDHDPVAGLPLIPKKRMSSGEADDKLGSSQISPAQLSSNKLTRHSHKSKFS
ncbi:hypothetical protein AAZX31_01G040100 [Glycine max]